MKKNRKPQYEDTKTVKFGEHLIFDAYGCDPKKLNDPKLCTKLMLDICKMGGMKKLMDPVIIDASSNEALGGKDPGGYSGFLIIQESHISIHTFPRRRFVSIDVYSCRDFATQRAVIYFMKAFGMRDIETHTVVRGHHYPPVNLVP